MQVPGGTRELEEPLPHLGSQGKFNRMKPGEWGGGGNEEPTLLWMVSLLSVQKAAGVASSCQSSGKQTPGQRGLVRVMAS